MAIPFEQRSVRGRPCSLAKAVFLSAACLLSSGLPALGFQPDAANSLAVEGKAEALDANTLLLNNQEIDLFGIIGPDLTTPVGLSARTWLNKKMGSAPVRCEPTSAPGTYPIVAKCWRGDADISAELLRGGFALTDPALLAETTGNEDLLTRYELAEREARFARAGLWSQEPIAALSELKDWQTFFAGVLAILAAVIGGGFAFLSIRHQIAATQKIEKDRLSSEKSSLARALSAELKSIIQHAQYNRTEILRKNEVISPSRLALALPLSFPIFTGAANKVGLLDADTTEKVFRAYSELIHFSGEIKTMADNDSSADMFLQAKTWPLTALDLCLASANAALAALGNTK